MGRYEVEAEFGRGEGEYLVDLWGVTTTPAGHVLIYDAGNTRVLRLDGRLRLMGEFGRDGRGPGEFSYQRVLPGHWIAVDDSSIFVLDLRSLSRFDLYGHFSRYGTREIPFPLPIRRIAVQDGRVLYSVDAINRQDGRRVLETWRIEPSPPHTRLRADPMPTLPRAGGRTVGLILQAEPLWAVHQRCVFISDGASDWVLRVDLATNRADTLYLPPRSMPHLTDEDEDWLEQGQRALGRVGNVPRTDRVRPTAQVKWSSLVADPDGFLWLEPWRPPSRREDPLTAWVINPSTGAVDSLIVDRFPNAFLEPRAFVARRYDRANRLTVIERHAVSREGD